MNIECIKKIKEKGFSPQIVLDIGAHHGSWTKLIYPLFPNAQYLLFEAIEYDELNVFKPIQNVYVSNICLNDSNKEITWYQKKNTGDSMFKEKTHHFENCETIQKMSYALDSILNLPDTITSIFIKIDCQGAEIPILRGSTNILKKADFILLEIPFFGQYNEGVPSFLEHIQFMDSIGFIPFDIVEPHYIKGYLLQLDILFIRKTHPFTINVQNDILTE